jgi:hypothetical protein
LNSSYVVPDLKEKSRVEELGYILFEPQNYKWLTLLYLYADVYLKPGYEKDTDMAKLYIQYKVADCRGKHTSKYLMEIDNAFPDYPKIKRATKHKEVGGWDNIEKSINIRDHVVIHNETGKGFIYGILSQLNPKLWGGTKLQ